MDQWEKALRLILEAVQQKEADQTDVKDSGRIPVGISNRHVHLSQKDLDCLFGVGYQLTKMKDLSQPGQYACKEMVILCGPKGAIEKVRVLGPVRSQTQVEILQGDSFKLGIPAPVRLSGDLQGTPGITIVGPKGSVQIREGVMVAQRHIHMSCEDAKAFGVADGEVVSIEVAGPRGGIYHQVAIRANATSALEFHVDTEEANAMNLTPESTIAIIKK